MKIYFTGIRNFHFLNGIIAWFRDRGCVAEREEDADTIWIEWMTADAAPIIERNRGKRICMRCHAYEIEQAASVRCLPFDAVSLVVFVSRVKQQRFLRRYPDITVRSTVIPNAVDTRVFVAAPRRECRFILGMIGRVYPNKDVAPVMTSLTALDKRWRLLVQGAVPRKHRRYLTWLMLLRWCLRLGNRVDFLPHTEALLAFYRSIDAVVSNSRAESFHMSIAEGMACGCWPVIRDWEGARELYPASQIFSGRGRMIELIRRYERMSPVEREAATLEMRAFVEQRYSIPVVGERISAALAAL